jgi:anti-sigma B factor antagonist
MNDFSLRTRRDEDISIIEIDGFLDAHTAPQLEEELQRLIDQGQLSLVIDFTRLQYISSAGLGVFMAYIEEIREKGGDMVLTGMSENIYNVFDLLGFPLLFGICATTDDALLRFSSPPVDPIRS